ncbi:hypothetical protein BJ508DRAFT_326908 [Ascobolus immersus RN42]|uniref:Uncharacterized protein n=1 Tax=Ascobolus immersus RN42 TaxID=1160509 RepID=A0A3N4I3Y0_ASCIM|nr:hypothetical protein BJ508DRAFT_326908 [Ascobolus immersus RN42]
MPSITPGFNNGVDTLRQLNDLVDDVWKCQSFGQAWMSMRFLETLRYQHPLGHIYLSRMRTTGSVLPGEVNSAEWELAREELLNHPCIVRLIDEITREIETSPNATCCGLAVNVGERLKDRRPDLEGKISYHHTGSHGLGSAKEGGEITVWDSSAGAAVSISRCTTTAPQNEKKNPAQMPRLTSPASSWSKVNYSRQPLRTKLQSVSTMPSATELMKASLKGVMGRSSSCIYFRTTQAYENISSDNSFSYMVVIDMKTGEIVIKDPRIAKKKKEHLLGKFILSRALQWNVVQAGLLEFLTGTRDTIDGESNKLQLDRNEDCILRLGKLFHSN